MRSETENPREYLPLSPTMFHILLSLADGERHGYGIKLDIENRTNGVVVLGPGTLYGNIKRLLEMDFISESGDRPDPDRDDERRRYYSLTVLGRRVLAAEAERLRDLVRVAEAKHLLLDPESA